MVWAGVEKGNGFGSILDGKYVRVELGKAVNFVWDAKDMIIEGRMGLAVRLSRGLV